MPLIRQASLQSASNTPDKSGKPITSSRQLLLLLNPGDFSRDTSAAHDIGSGIGCAQVSTYEAGFAAGTAAAEARLAIHQQELMSQATLANEIECRQLMEAASTNIADRIERSLRLHACAFSEAISQALEGLAEGYIEQETIRELARLTEEAAAFRGRAEVHIRGPMAFVQHLSTMLTGRGLSVSVTHDDLLEVEITAANTTIAADLELLKTKLHRARK